MSNEPRKCDSSKDQIIKGVQLVQSILHEVSTRAQHQSILISHSWRRQQCKEWQISPGQCFRVVSVFPETFHDDSPNEDTFNNKQEEWMASCSLKFFTEEPKWCPIATFSHVKLQFKKMWGKSAEHCLVYPPLFTQAWRDQNWIYDTPLDWGTSTT